MVKERILVVDDEQAIVDLLHFILGNAGYEVASTGRGDEVIGLAEVFKPDLVILDIGLPGRSGLEVVPLLVELKTPTIVLSSHDRDDQIIEGLEVGAEDYVSKPFNHKELLLRIEKVIRRTKVEPSEQLIRIGSILIDLRRRVMKIDEREITLTPTEFKIMEYLALHAHTPVSAEELLKQVWNADEWTQGPEMVKVNISRLRKKIEPNPSHPRFLVNRWGFGYLLTDTCQQE